MVEQQSLYMHVTQLYIRSFSIVTIYIFTGTSTYTINGFDSIFHPRVRVWWWINCFRYRSMVSLFCATRTIRLYIATELNYIFICWICVLYSECYLCEYMCDVPHIRSIRLSIALVLYYLKIRDYHLFSATIKK